MTTENEEKVKFLDMQLIASVGFIIALLISILLSYDKKLSLENKKRLFSDEEAQNIALFQTILVLIISIGFLYINYEQYTISKKHHENDEQDLFLQTETAVLALISALVGLYIVYKNYRNKNLSIAETELF